MQMRRLGLFLGLACSLALVMPNSAIASPATDALAVVQQFVNAFNSGDTKAEAALCTSPASVLDDFSPHTWQGPTACADWGSGYEAWAKQNRVTGGTVTIAKPWHVDVTGSRAYIVVPATFAYKDQGKSVTQTGSVWTVVLVKAAAGWRITAWAWADGR
jgi:ketosteroid isomerase-like protein